MNVKRGCSTVRSRCIKFIEALHKLGYERIPLNQAKQMFSLTVDVFDRTSLKAYFGTYKHTTTHRLERRARYQSGTVSFKTIELTRKVAHQPGYLESLGLIDFEWQNRVLFVIPKFGQLVTTIMKADESMRNFSLSLDIPAGEGERSEENPAMHESLEVKHGCPITTNKQQQHGMRERNRTRLK